MPITTTQLERRRRHLGSSDMASILGLSPYSTAYDVWAMKTGRLPDTEETASMKAGTFFEDGVLAYAEEKLGTLIRNQYRSVKDRGIPIGANVDAIVVQTGEPVEAKTVGLLGFTNELWGDEGTDEVPDRVLIQATVHMICTEQELCHVAAFIAGRGFVPFVVRRDEDVVNVVKDTAVQFWEKFVLTDTPPDYSLPSAKTVARMRRTPASTVAIDSHLVKVWNLAKAVEKQAKEQTESAKIALLAALGDAEAGECEEGLVTFFEQTRKEAIVKESTFRVLRFKKAKENSL
jgi:putative phage-type endonuclease